MVAEVLLSWEGWARNAHAIMCLFRFARERPLDNPAPIAALLPVSLDAGPFAAAEPSLSQLCFGASQARGVHSLLDHDRMLSNTAC